MRNRHFTVKTTARLVALCLEGVLSPAEAARQCETDLALYLAERR